MTGLLPFCQLGNVEAIDAWLDRFVTKPLILTSASISGCGGARRNFPSRPADSE
jgi:hypothetical protein